MTRIGSTSQREVVPYCFARKEIPDCFVGVKWNSFSNCLLKNLFGIKSHSELHFFLGPFRLSIDCLVLPRNVFFFFNAVKWFQ